MTEIQFRSDVTVELIDSMGDEESIVRAARVSTKGSDSKAGGLNTGLIKYLYRESHGVPFESVVFTFYFEVPVFVSRQIVKHRLSGINEESGRYRELQPVFYVPPAERPLRQVGKTGNYEFEEGDPQQQAGLNWVLRNTAQNSWENYETLLDQGIAKEVARMHLPLNIYSSMYFTANLRSTLNFISLRKDWGPNAVHQSKAQYEISLVAEKMTEIVKEKVPTVWDSFVASGYQAV